MKLINNKTSQYSFLLFLIVGISLIVLIVFSIFALTFIIKNINLLLSPVSVQKEPIKLEVEKSKANI